MENRALLEECLAYFTSIPVLKMVLEHCSGKYRALGTVRGMIELRGLAKSDIEDLEGFTGSIYRGKERVSLSAVMLQKSIDKSRFAGIGLDELLEAYAGEPLKSKKQEISEERRENDDFYGRLAEFFAGTKAGLWLETVRLEEKKSYLCQLLYRKYREKTAGSKRGKMSLQEQFWNEMVIWLTSLNRLPVFEDKYEYLPAFSASVSGNPHYYDEDMEYILLLYYAINDMLCLEQKISSSMPAERRHWILLQAGLIRDDMSNDVLVYGIRAWTEEGEHLGIAGFYTQREAVSLTLSTVLRLKRAEPMDGCIYAVENPIVFAKLIEEQRSVVCVNGQPNLAVLLLLDRIAGQGGQIFYNGDFDPEGLRIAQRLKDRYLDHLSFWNYTEGDFQKALSEEEISDRRLKMLDGLVSPELVAMGERLRRCKRAGYQEKIYW